MAEVKNLTVADVRDLFAGTVTDNFAVTTDGQAHLNRIAKAITNESLDKRLLKQRDTLADSAFRKELEKVAVKNPEQLATFMADKANWKTKHIARKYGSDEE